MLQYELTPVPLSIFNLDSSLRTQKHTILKWIEKDLSVPDLPVSNEPTLAVIDLMMLLRMVCTDTSECQTFGALSDGLLNIISGLGCKYTAVIGDNHTDEESIKSSERARGGNVQMQENRNPTRATHLPKQCLKMLSNPKNKANIANFLLTDWIKKCKNELPEGHEIYLSSGFHDMKRVVKVVLGSQSEIKELQSDHEEADSRMFFACCPCEASIRSRQNAPFEHRFTRWSNVSKILLITVYQRFFFKNWCWKSKKVHF